MKRLLILTLALGLFCFSALAQDQPAAPQPSTEEQEKEKAERERNAYRLLDQIIDETQSLRLTENRVRVQINAADMLWDQNQARARSLFSMAAESVAELGRTQATSITRRGNGMSVPNAVGPQNLRSYQLRQELVLMAARHDATLAYQLLAITKPPLPPPTDDGRGNRPGITSDDGLEQALLSRVATLDPKLAAQNAEQMMDKGQFPFSLPQVIDQLARQDPDAAAKLADKVVKRLQTTNLLTNSQAGALVQTMLISGPRPPGETAASTSKPPPPGRGWPSVLEQSTYVDLLSTVVDAALKATPATPNSQRIQRPGLPRPNQTPQPPTDAQTEQNNARRLLGGLQSLMPMIDQYLPAKGTTVRQKMTEMGMQSNSMMNMAQLFNGQNGTTIDALVQAAASAPQQVQARIYQQAAYKALEEGDTDRARQIATDHLQSNARDAVMKRIDFREMSKKAETARIEDVRQAAARLQSDNEKLDLLIQIANDTQKSNPKLALQVLEDARQITNHRATGYDHFEQQLKVAHAFAAIDPARSFEVMDPGISQLNELLSAAAILSGFEINMFRDGEMAILSGNGLTSTIGRYGQELALLARSDFDRSEALAGRFQFPEARIMARMAIVQGLLDTKTALGNVSLGNRGGIISQE